MGCKVLHFQFRNGTCMIHGERVLIRPVERGDLTLLDAWANDVAANGEYNTFGLRPMNGMEGPFSQTGLLDDRSASLVVATLSGTQIGTMSYHQQRYGPNTGSIAYMIGLSIAASERGKGYGSEAQRLLARYLFDTYPIARVEASTDITNIPEQRALEKAGFVREGVLRQAQWRAGTWHDLMVYSKLRGE